MDLQMVACDTSGVPRVAEPGARGGRGMALACSVSQERSHL